MFENTLVFFLSFSLSVQSRTVHVAKGRIFPTLPLKSEASRLSVAHSLQHAPTHGPITDHFRARQPMLSADSSQGTHCGLPAGCSTCARERCCHHPLGSYSKQLREFLSWLEPRWSQDPKHLLGWGRAAPPKGAAAPNAAPLQHKNTTISEAKRSLLKLFSTHSRSPFSEGRPLIYLPVCHHQGPSPTPNATDSGTFAANILCCTDFRTAAPKPCPGSL